MYHHARGAFAATLLLSVSCWAQLPPADTPGAITPVGSSYRVEGPGIPAAPGQLLIVSVLGVKTKVGNPQAAVAANGSFPKTLAGISVDLVEGTTSTPLELRGIQQGFCPIQEACSTVTSITLQIPFRFVPSAPPAFLRIRENGSSVGVVMLGYVPDRVHVLNTCDSTLVFISAASGVPADVCAPVVMVNARLNSLYNLIRGGDTLLMWGYGLGAFRGPGDGVDQITASRVTAPMLVSFDFRPNAAASPGVAGYGITTEPQYAGHLAGGLYQINFVVPPIPPGLPACDGKKIKSNLTVTLSGPNSYDAAQLCVEP